MRKTVELVEQALGVLQESSAVQVDESELRAGLAAWQRVAAEAIKTRAQGKIQRDPKVQKLTELIGSLAEALQDMRYKDSAKQRTANEMIKLLRAAQAGELDMKQTNAMLDDIKRLLDATHARDLSMDAESIGGFERAGERLFDAVDSALRDWLYDIFHPMHALHDTARAEESVKEAAEDRYKRALEESREVARLVQEARRRIGSMWGGAALRVVPTVDWDKRYPSSSLSGSTAVYVGTHMLTMWPPGEDEEGNRRDLTIGDVEEGDRQDRTPAFDDYQRLISELEEPGSIEREGERVLTLYTARPSEDRDQIERSGKLPGGVFLSNDLSHVEGLALDLRGTRGERDIWLIKIKRRHLLRTLKGRTEYYQIVGTKPVEVEDMELFTKA